MYLIAMRREITFYLSVKGLISTIASLINKIGYSTEVNCQKKKRESKRKRVQ